MTKETIGRLVKILKKTPEWASGRSFPTDHFDDYMAGKGSVAASVDGIFGLFSLGLQECKQGLLAAAVNQFESANRHMAFGFSRMIYAEAIDVFSMKNSQRTTYCDLNGSAHLMLGAIAMGRPELVKPLHQTIFDAIEGGYGMRDGHDRQYDTTLRYAAFALSIVGDWLGQPLDLKRYALPSDPEWEPLVANWRSTDNDVVLSSLRLACDTHVARIALNDRESNSGKFEFDSEFLAVYPTEILAVLRLRDLLGLPNPQMINHALMKTPYAAITCAPAEVKEHDELLAKFLTMVRERDPQALPPGL